MAPATRPYRLDSLDREGRWHTHTSDTHTNILSEKSVTGQVPSRLLGKSRSLRPPHLVLQPGPCRDRKQLFDEVKHNFGVLSDLPLGVIGQSLAQEMQDDLKRSRPAPDGVHPVGRQEEPGLLGSNSRFEGELVGFEASVDDPLQALAEFGVQGFIVNNAA